MENTFKQTVINGFRVMVFTGYDGTQLFINHPDGHNIYAHRVSGDAIERAKVIIAANSTVEEFTQPKADRMLCLSERRVEFTEALQRGRNSDLKVYKDWDLDAFVVVNQDNKAEYRVRFEIRNGQLWSDCECPDFSYRKRVCKHQSEVLTDCFFGVASKI